MRTQMILTLTGPDRVGVVEQVTAAILAVDGNIETSRMVRLAGEFATLVLWTIPDGRLAETDGAFAELRAAGYRTVLSPAQSSSASAEAGRVGYRIEVSGADHEGIVHDIARGLAASGINIESMDTEVVPAPVTGTDLFKMSAAVAVPASADESGWQEQLFEAAADAGVDVEIVADESH